MNDPVPAIFKRHVGVWQGKYIKSNAQGQYLSSFQGTFTVMIDGIIYRQRNDYQYEDGKTLTLNFQGTFEDGILQLDSPNYDNFKSFAWDSGYNTIGFRVDKKQDNDLITFMETINLLTDTYRVRTTQEFKNNEFVGVNLIEENKIE
ncbi:MAG: hypothetical protein AB4041_11355 [Microcystaceae cyanobacterium]